jgi:hypothetical protein
MMSQGYGELHADDVGRGIATVSTTAPVSTIDPLEGVDLR